MDFLFKPAFGFLRAVFYGIVIVGVVLVVCGIVYLLYRTSDKPPKDGEKTP